MAFGGFTVSSPNTRAEGDARVQGAERMRLENRARNDALFNQQQSEFAQTFGRGLSDGAASTRGKAGTKTQVSPQAATGMQMPAKNTLQYNPKTVEGMGNMAKWSQHLTDNPNDMKAMGNMVQAYNDSELSSAGNASQGRVNPDTGAISFYDEQGQPLPGSATTEEFSNLNNYVKQISNPKYEQYQQELANQPKEFNKDMFNAEKDMRKEYASGNKEFDSLRTQIDNVHSSYSINPDTGEFEGTGQGDMALITGFMKMLDPGSVVRETEYAQAQNTSGLYDKLKAMVAKGSEGTDLTNAQRKQFVEQMNKYWGNALGHMRKRKADFSSQAEYHGLDPSRVVGSIKYGDRGSIPTGGVEVQPSNRPMGLQSSGEQIQQPQQAQAQMPQPGSVENGYVYIGGNPNDENSWRPTQ